MSKLISDYLLENSIFGVQVRSKAKRGSQMKIWHRMSFFGVPKSEKKYNWLFYWFSLHFLFVGKISKICNHYMWFHNLLIFPTYFLRNVGKVSKIVPNVWLILILLIFPTFLQHHQFRVTRKVGKISKLCNHI